MAHVVIGPVAGLWRYPVKSMQGEGLDAVPVSERGFLGDRAYALIDRDSGKVGSAKNPRRWPKLLDFRAVFREPPSPDRSSPAVRIDFPDGGGSVSSDSPDVNDRLSRAFNHAVVLSSAAPSAPLSVTFCCRTVDLPLTRRGLDDAGGECGHEVDSDFSPAEPVSVRARGAIFHREGD